jgi:glutaredoxin
MQTSIIKPRFAVAEVRKICVILLGFLLSPVHAEVYRWVDDAGQTHFGDKPPIDRESSKVKIRINTYESPSIQALESATTGDQKVVIYSAAWCHVCRKAKAYFADNDIDYIEYDVEKSDQGKRAFKKLKGKGVPIILVGDQRLNGFSPVSFQTIYKKSEH